MSFAFFENFPVSAIGNIWQFLPYEDAKNFRRTCKSINQTYFPNRSLIQGPTCSITIKNDYKVYVKDRHVEDLTSLLNSNCQTLVVEQNKVDIAKIQRIIRTWKIKKVDYTGDIIEHDVLEYFDSISKTIDVHVKEFTFSTVPTSKIHQLDVVEPIRFYNLRTILAKNRKLKILRIAVTFASLHIIREMLLQENGSHLKSWEFSVIHWQTHIAYLNSLPLADDHLQVRFRDGRFIIEKVCKI